MIKIWVLVLLAMGVVGDAVAQKLKLVTGKVLYVPDIGKPRPFPSSETVRIFAFNTVATAKDALDKLQKENILSADELGADNETRAEFDGSYEILVSENGALLIYVGMNRRIEEVNYRNEIPIIFKDAIPLLPDEFPFIVRSEGIMIHSEPLIIIGNQILMKGNITFPKNPYCKIIPYLIDCNTEQVITNLEPIVFDGADNKEELRFYTFKDTVQVLDPKRIYIARAKVVICDYTHKTYEDDWQLTSPRILRPMEFLEYSLPDYELDPNKYKEKPKIEKCDTEGNISLSFVVNRAELDNSDPNNTLQMSKLRNDLMAIINGEGTTLKEFKIMGVSSPEGRYDRNLTLAKERTHFALKQITSMIPASNWARVYKHPVETRVATWNEVADLLEKDTLLAEAAQVREITAQYKSQDAQYAAIRKLPFYETAIMNTFPRLRTVHYGYKYDIFRELSPEEIVKRYYQDGKRQFTRYEYWHLFQQIKDPKEAEKLYRKAYKETMTSDGKPWLLAANNLAVALLKRDTFDVEILKPLINYKRKVNSINRYDDGLGVEITEINPENVVANQLAMYIRAYNFAGADTLAQMLPNTDKFRMVKAFSSCLRGRYNYHKAKTEKELKQFRETFELMKNSSPINHVIMCMAMRNDGLNKEALKVLETIPVSTKTKYLKLQLFCRMNIKSKNIKDLYYGDLELEHIQTAYKMLDEIIKEDAKYRDIALNDGEFSEEFIEFYNDPEKRKKQWGLFD